MAIATTDGETPAIYFTRGKREKIQLRDGRHWRAGWPPYHRAA